MIHIAICDDDTLQIKELKKVLICQLELGGLEYHLFEFENGESFLSTLAQTSYDLIFLDIEMGNMNGIDVARSIRKSDRKSIIIFITSYPDFVFQGYEVKAFNYILKPYKQSKIIDVFNSALEELKEDTHQIYSIETKKGIYKVDLTDVMYFTSDKRKVIVHLSDNILEYYEKLDYIEQVVPSNFVRIHQRYLINLNYVTAVESTYVTLEQETLPVSRKYSQSLFVAYAKTLLS